MSLRVFNSSSNRRSLKSAVVVLGLLMTAAMGLGPASAQAQDIEPDNPEKRLIFEALNQWMCQNAVAFSIDKAAMQDPFRPINYLLSEWAVVIQ